MSRKEYSAYKGPLTLAPPVTREQIEAHLHPNCSCYSCRENREWLAKHFKDETKQPDDRIQHP